MGQQPVQVGAEDERLGSSTLPKGTVPAAAAAGGLRPQSVCDPTDADAFDGSGVIRHQIGHSVPDAGHSMGRLAQAVQQTVKQFPPLTTAQRAHLSRIIRGESGADNAGAA